MCDVIFITPNMDGEIGAEAMGTLQLASILKLNGISCEILPFFEIGNIEEFDAFMENAIQILEEKKPKIVSFYTRCDVYHIDLKLAQTIKARWNHICIVCGGPQSDITAEDTLSELSFIDYICRGEGETTVYPLFHSILQGTPDLSIAGLVYRLNGEIHTNPRPALIENLDDLPMLDYSMLHYIGNGCGKRSSFPIEIGRGCPFACTFCSTNSFWGRKYRLKSPERIYREVKDVNERFGFTRFKFTHDMFTLHRDVVKETCQLLRTLDFPIRWGGSSRVDCIDPEFIDIMADAGLYGLFLGIETGSPRMQKIINKKLNLDDTISIARYMEQKNIQIKASFIHGFPEETEEDLSQTIALLAELMKLRNVSVVTHLCSFYVGTEITKQYRDVLTPVDFYSNVTGALAIEACKDLIQDHPNLFLHLLEYKTELRTKLKYFDLFIRVWQSQQPVYQYIAEKYPKDRLIDMYYDFVNANQQVFDEVYNHPEHLWGNLFVSLDKFPACFSTDENYDLISDWCKYKILSVSDKVQNGEAVCEYFCLNPIEAYSKPLQECMRCVAIVNWKDQKRSIDIFG